MANLEIKKRYKKPAVKEAIFEAKFDHENFDSAVPGQIFEQIKSNYPKKQDIIHERVFLEKESTEASSSLPLIIQAPLMRAKKEDGSELLQFGPGIALANRFKYS